MLLRDIPPFVLSGKNKLLYTPGWMFTSWHCPSKHVPSIFFSFTILTALMRPDISVHKNERLASYSQHPHVRGCRMSLRFLSPVIIPSIWINSVWSLAIIPAQDIVLPAAKGDKRRAWASWAALLRSPTYVFSDYPAWNKFLSRPKKKPNSKMLQTKPRRPGYSWCTLIDQRHLKSVQTQDMSHMSLECWYSYGWGSSHS